VEEALEATLAVDTGEGLASRVKAIAKAGARILGPTVGSLVSLGTSMATVTTEGIGLVSAGALLPQIRAVVLSFPAVGLASVEIAVRGALTTDVEGAAMAVRPATAGVSWWEIVEPIVGVILINDSSPSPALALLAASLGLREGLSGIDEVEAPFSTILAQDDLVAAMRELDLPRRVTGMAER